MNAYGSLFGLHDRIEYDSEVYSHCLEKPVQTESTSWNSISVSFSSPVCRIYHIHMVPFQAFWPTAMAGPLDKLDCSVRALSALYHIITIVGCGHCTLSVSLAYMHRYKGASNIRDNFTFYQQIKSTADSFLHQIHTWKLKCGIKKQHTKYRVLLSSTPRWSKAVLVMSKWSDRTRLNFIGSPRFSMHKYLLNLIFKNNKICIDGYGVNAKDKF